MDVSRLSLLIPLAGSSLGVAAIAFFVSLADDRMLNEPFSNFRYGPWAGFGVAGFLLLIGIGVIYSRVAFLFADRSVQFFALLSTLLIGFVAVTPTVHTGHELASFGLLIMLYGYYAVRLYVANSVWVIVHLIVPAVIPPALLWADVVGFGTIQKTFILYLVFAVNVDCLILMQIPLFPEWRRESKGSKRVTVRIPSPRVKYRQRFEGSLT